MMWILGLQFENNYFLTHDGREQVKICGELEWNVLVKMGLIVEATWFGRNTNIIE